MILQVFILYTSHRHIPKCLSLNFFFFFCGVVAYARLSRHGIYLFWYLAWYFLTPVLFVLFFPFRSRPGQRASDSLRLNWREILWQPSFTIRPAGAVSWERHIHLIIPPGCHESRIKTKLHASVSCTF